MRSDIDNLCDAFIAALTNAGYALKNIENYKQICNRFKRFCTENSYDTYAVNIGQMFADNMFNEKTGEVVGYRRVMYGRFVRLINSFYLQGTFDFSMVTKEKNLPTSTQLIEPYQNYTEHSPAKFRSVHKRKMSQQSVNHQTGARPSAERAATASLQPEPVSHRL